MPKPSVEFFANGKLILTAEYFVLHGAKALALPVKFGQSLNVFPPVHNEESGENRNSGIDSSFVWNSYFNNKLWFSAELNADDFNVVTSNDIEKTRTLVTLLETIMEMNPEFRIDPGTRIKTVLDFNPEWGLGSSSTLVSNMAEWAGVDPLILNEKVFHGSGFDIACAKANGPIFYTKLPKTEPVELNYSFLGNLFLVYSGKKKSTREAISKQNLMVSEKKIAEITALSDAFSRCADLNEFQQLIELHEKEVSALIGEVPVQARLFSDFNGAIKSLGAWGGDFLLAATDWNSEKVKNYFAKRGLTEVFNWNEFVKVDDQ